MQWPGRGRRPFAAGLRRDISRGDPATGTCRQAVVLLVDDAGTPAGRPWVSGQQRLSAALRGGEMERNLRFRRADLDQLAGADPAGRD